MLLAPVFTYGHCLLYCGFKSLSFYQFLAHLSVCLPIYRHAQGSPSCLSNFLVSLCSWFASYYLYSVPDYPCSLPRFAYYFRLSATHPGSFPEFSFVSCHLYSAHVGSLCIVSLVYLGAATWFQVAANPFPPLGPW